MERKDRSIKAVLLTTVLLISTISINAQTRYAVADGNWNSVSTWSATSGGAPGASVPNATSDVIIENGVTVTVTADATCASITFTQQSATLTVNSLIVLTVSGTIRLNSLNNSNSLCVVTGGGTLSCANIITGTDANPNAVYTHTFISSITGLDITNDLSVRSYRGTNNGRLNNGVFYLQDGILSIGQTLITVNERAVNTSTFSMAAGPQTGTLVLGGATPFNLSGTGTSNITVNGTSALVHYTHAGAQSVASLPYTDLTVSGGGIKTMQGNISVSGTLSLEDGNLSLGSGAGNLTLTAGAIITTPGSFGNTHMIVCDGSGSLIKQGTTAAEFQVVYPVGTGVYYTPFEITSLTASVAGTGSVIVRAVASTAPGPPAAAPTDLNKYWSVSAINLSNINAALRITYDNPGEIGTGGDQTQYVPFFYSGGVWTQPGVYSGEGINPMTVSDISTFAGQWTAREAPTYATYYSYQSGAWNSANTWTTDPSGTLSVNPKVPSETDRVIILNSRTVTTTANGENVLSVQINEGGILDLGTFTSHDFTVIRGKGLVRLQTSLFPSGDWSNFVSEGGGTIEYYNTSGFTFSQLVYNHLIINLSTSAVVATLTGNMTINGNLTITNGKFQINDGTSAGRNLHVEGDVNVSPDGSIGIGTGNANHRFIVKGDFTNDGIVRLTNQDTPNYTTTPGNGRSDLVFNNPAADQYLMCNGQTDIYRVEIDKGIDQTYVLNIDASDNTKFRLFGRSNLQTSPPANPPPSIENGNALGLLAGTVRLGPNIVLPNLSGNAVYNIDLDAQLWLDGATVTFSVVASNSSIVVYGSLRVSNMAILNANGRQGIVTRDQSSLHFESGEITTECIRTSFISGSHRGAFTMTGGTLNITGNSLNIAGLNIYASFTLPYPDNVFRMSGGTINIISPTTIDGGPGTSFSLLLGSGLNNSSVTGGTINITVPTNRNAYINTTVPLWNINFTSSSDTYRGQIQAYAGNASPAIPAIPAQPLIVYNDLNIQNTAVFNANSSDVTVGRNFSIDTNAEYESGDNTTMFDGVGGQRFTNSGTVNNGTGLYNLTISDSSNSDIYANDLIIRGSLAINNGSIFSDVGHSINVAGDIINSGIHISQAGGAIILNGTEAQTIGGSGNGSFGNLTINKTSGTTTLSADQSLSGNLRLANGVIDLGIFNLGLGPSGNIYDAITGTTTNFSAAKMIRLAGNASNGGLTRAYNSTAGLLFPVGTDTDYTPATIQFSAAPSQWGAVTIRPVKQVHPLVTSSNALTYYWVVTSSGFSGIQAGSVSHAYQYATSDIVGTEASYIPAAYRPDSWNPINDISQVVDATNTILFSAINHVEGDYTAGEFFAFQNIKVFFSRQSGSWDDPDTWSSEGIGGPVDGTIPGSGNPVVIGNGTLNHTVTVPTDLNNITVGGLRISLGSTLDLQSTTGHNFGTIPDTRVSGTGNLRISSSGETAVFPGGDFGNFLSKGGGTVEYYSTADMGSVTFTLPTSYISGGININISGYNNLVTSPSDGKNIVLPNTSFSVYDDFTVSGSGISQMNILGTTRVVTVDSNLVVRSGTLRFMNGNNTAQSIIIKGDVIIDNGAEFDVNTAGEAANQLTIYGNLINNGILDMNAGANQVCNVTFAGNTNKVIEGSGTVTNFNFIEVNKGTSRNTILDVRSSVLTLNTAISTALTLTNGTFRLTSPITLNLTNSGNFTIPITGSLSVNGGTINIGGAEATDATDLKLDGRLEVLAGAVNIGTHGTDLNNDIEYSSGGTPEIIISGGSLYVNGQIRRGTTINTGSLNYTQSSDSSTVTIAGRNATTLRPMFEILNTGSKFNMSGGILNITGSFNNSDHIDLFLVPDSANVTGGTILLGSAATPSGTAFNMATSVQLYTVEIDATVSNKILDLRIFPLILKNNLTINGNSVFRANGLNVTIEGSLSNSNSTSGTGLNTGGYQPGSSNQRTTFNGSGLKTITGAGSNLTNFANLTVYVNDTLLLSPNSNIRINSGLIIVAGILDDGGNNIFLAGNADNEGEHVSSLAGGGIHFEGNQPQVISGSGDGVFGNVTINNTTAINIIDNTIIRGILTFERGVVYLDDYLLTFDINASVNGVPDVTSMIILNGVISDAGVKKIFPSGPYTFTFPVGVAGKYTPVSYNFTSNPNNGASITVDPVNYAHPVMDLPEGNELNYYWNVTSDGFVEPYTVDHNYSYMADDVTGIEAEYVTGRFVNSSWTPPGGIDESSINTLTHQINLNSKDFIDGEYTAGNTTNFTNLNILYSIKTGNWFGDNTWSLTDGGPPCGFDPDGNPVVINPGHTVTLNNNSANAYSVTISGILEAGLTLFHNLGHVNGNGILRLASTPAGIFIFPGGNFHDFVNTSGSTVEFFGNNLASLPAKPGNIYKPYQNVIFSGTGKKTIPAEDLKILNNLTIQNGSTVLSNELYNKRIFISGDWTDNNTTTVGGFIPGRGLVVFEGTDPQILSVSNGSTTERFFNFRINNPAGLTLSGSGKADISNLLYLSNGIITTTGTNLLSISNTGNTPVIGGNAGSFISGPLQKRILPGRCFNFPVGDANGSRYGEVAISNVNVAGDYTARYFNHNPLIDGYDPGNRTAPIDVVSDSEYWSLNGPLLSSGNVTLRWDPLSGIIPSDAATRAKLRVVEWNPSWINLGNGKIIGDANSGTIITSSVVSLAGDHQFTIGIESLPTATITSGAAEICDDGSSTNISIALTGTPPWTIRYMINGANETTVTNIASTPYSLVVSNAIPALASGGPGLYAFSVSYVRDATGSTGIRDFSTTADITLNASPSPLISGLTTTPVNSIVPYNTPDVAGIIYLWSVSGGDIQSGQGTNSIIIQWGPGPTGTVTLTETVIAGGCSRTTIPYNVTITDIPDPLVFGSSSVCVNSVETYSTPFISSHTYSWSVTGGTYTTGPTDNIINVLWVTPGSAEVTVTETGSTSVSNTLPVTVNILPPSDNTVSDPVVSAVTPANIIISGTPAGINYQLRLNSDNTPVGPPVSSMGGGDVIITVTQTVTTIYNVWATNEYGCGVMLADLAVVTVVNDLIWTGSISSEWNNPGNWLTGLIPDGTLNVQIPDVANKPVLSTGAEAVVYDLTVESGSSLVITGNTIRVGGSITGAGNIDASAGTIEMNGSSAQVIGAGIFTGNTINNLIINNSAGITLTGSLSISGIVTVTTGDLASDGNLTLLSTSSQTALIDGSGSGNVTGDLTMQRYLPSGFGYKYFSSPFQSATVSEFGDDMDLTAPFTTFYRYDENRMVGGNPASGWVAHKDPSYLLSPLAGYAVNFGSSALPNTVDVTGEVNNGSLSVTLYNHNNPYTLGFNLVGNPYPSPIDWDAPSGWTKTNIDNALYFFSASTTDEYGGTYSTYINGISSDGLATNIIPSMQGFFIHVSDGAYPVTGTLGLDNNVRINNLTHSFIKSDQKSLKPLIRLTAGYSDNPASTDPLVIYFDEKATPEFDGLLDALKLINTDLTCANIYSVIPGGKKLSINALPFDSENTYSIPLGIRLYLDGNLTFRISQAEELIPGTKVFLTDLATGEDNDLLSGNEYRVFLSSGEYNSRFILNLAPATTGIDEKPKQEWLFSIYSYRGILRGEFNISPGQTGTLYIHNLTGNMLRTYKINDPGYHEFTPGLKNGFYVATFVTAKRKESKKIMILNP